MIRAALVTAGGHGKRMASSVPKQYLELAGVPILARALLAFQRHPMTERIVVTVPAGDEEYVRDHIVRPFGLTKVSDIAAGGAERQASVYNGLQRLAETDLVAVHDGVRPLVSPEIISQSYRAAETQGAAVACAPVKETLKRRNGEFLDTIPRSDLWLAHTPQTFRTALIIRAHEAAMEEGFAATDDAMLVERLGRPVAVVPDLDSNIKITTPFDMQLAALLLERTEPAQELNHASRESSRQP